MIVSAWRSARSMSARRSACTCAGQRVDGAAQPQPHVGGHLVVARTPGVQPLAGVADQRRQPLLDVEMDVLEVDRPRERAAARSRPRWSPGRARCRPNPAAERMPVAASMRAWAREPAMSASARRRSNADRCRVALDAARSRARRSVRTSRRRQMGRRQAVLASDILVFSCAGRIACRQWSLGSFASARRRAAGQGGWPETKHRTINQRDRPSLAHGHDACMSPPIMRSIIRQNANQPAFARFPQPGHDSAHPGGGQRGGGRCTRSRAKACPRRCSPDGRSRRPIVEPYLFLVLAVLWLASPRLARLPFATGAGIVALVTIAAGAGILFAIFYRARAAAAGDAAALARVGAARRGRASRSISTCAHARCRRPSPRRGCRRCRRASARTSCSTASMRCCRWSAASRSAPRPRCRTWRTCSAC